MKRFLDCPKDAVPNSFLKYNYDTIIMHSCGDFDTTKRVVETVYECFKYRLMVLCDPKYASHIQRIVLQNQYSCTQNVFSICSYSKILFTIDRKNECYNSISYNPILLHKELIKQRITELDEDMAYIKTLDDDWDGYDAIAPSPRAINDTETILNKCIEIGFLPTSIYPDGSDGICITFRHHIQTEENKHIAYYWFVDNEPGQLEGDEKDCIMTMWSDGQGNIQSENIKIQKFIDNLEEYIVKVRDFLYESTQIIRINTWNDITSYLPINCDNGILLLGNEVAYYATDIDDTERIDVISNDQIINEYLKNHHFEEVKIEKL